MASLIDQAYQAAKEARARAHAPYSRFAVGAALVTRSGRIITGCNVENASYGATVCAERIAVFRAVMEGVAGELAAVVIVADAEPVAVPCGMCLQVLAEFCGPDLEIHLADLTALREHLALRDVLPRTFDKSALP